jgi:hypothetical protein
MQGVHLADCNWHCDLHRAAAVRSTFSHGGRRCRRRSAMNVSLAPLDLDRAYFIVMFDDEYTLIFLGESRRSDGTEIFLFREIRSDGTEPKFFVNKQDADHLLLDEAGLIAKLRKCFEGKLSEPPETANS